MDQEEHPLDIALTDEEFARRVEAELSPERVNAWPSTTNPAVAEAVLRALGLRIVDAVDQPHFHWLHEIDRRIVLNMHKEGDTWSVGLGN